MTDSKAKGGGSGLPPAPLLLRSEPTVHHLRLLLVVAEELHFGRAADRLFITQPALSRQIGMLEQRLGVRLFVRGSRSVEATAACRALLPGIRDVVQAMDQLCRSAEAQHRELAERLVVGSIGAESSIRHARVILAELRARRPELTIELRNMHLVNHMRDLLDGEVDVAFLRPPVPPGIQIRHLATEPRIACLPADDPLASRPAISLADLAGRPVVNVPAQLPRLWWDFWAVDPRPDGSPVRYVAGRDRHGGAVARRRGRRGDGVPAARPASSSPVPASAMSMSPTFRRALRPSRGPQPTGTTPLSLPSGRPPPRPGHHIDGATRGSCPFVPCAACRGFAHVIEPAPGHGRGSALRAVAVLPADGHQDRLAAQLPGVAITGRP
ncbi:LysR family transcriptional regulator [Streptomyces eurythermus]